MYLCMWMVSFDVDISRLQIVFENKTKGKSFFFVSFCQGSNILLRVPVDQSVEISFHRDRRKSSAPSSAPFNFLFVFCGLASIVSIQHVIFFFLLRVKRPQGFWLFDYPELFSQLSLISGFRFNSFPLRRPVEGFESLVPASRSRLASWTFPSPSLERITWSLF